MAHQKTMYLLPVLCHTFTTILVLQNTYVCYLSFGRSGAQAGLKSHKGCIQSVVQGNCLNGGSTKKESASSFTQVVGRIYNLVAVRQRASVSHCQPEVVHSSLPLKCWGSLTWPLASSMPRKKKRSLQDCSYTLTSHNHCGTFAVFIG